MSKRQSRHTATLIDLGFEPMEEAEQIYLSRRMGRRLDQVLNSRELSRRERRLLKKELSTPCFVLVHAPRAATYATDETGTHWCVSGLIDPRELTSIGFENDTDADVQPFVNLPELMPERMH